MEGFGVEGSGASGCYGCYATAFEDLQEAFHTVERRLNDDWKSYGWQTPLSVTGAPEKHKVEGSKNQGPHLLHVDRQSSHRSIFAT